MSIITTILIALALSMDAFAVAIVQGVSMKKWKTFDALKTAAFFGSFQAIMPLAGWAGGIGLSRFISGFDHWIAFILLLFVGSKMIYESRRISREERTTDFTSNYTLLLLSVATSIDALAVGITISFLGVSIIIPSAIIGSITFFVAFLGVAIGRRFGHIVEHRMELIGGVLLICIGVKILIEHLM